MRYLVIGIMVMFMGFQPSATAGDYQKGKHYQVVPGAKRTASPELKEFFSLYCPHCRSVERILQMVKPNLPKGMGFSRVHVDFLGGLKDGVQETSTQALVYANNIGRGEEYIHFMFERIHAKNMRPQTKDDVKRSLVAFGIPPKTVADVFVDDKIKVAQVAMSVEQDKMYRLGVLKSVPSFLVNGKYMIILRSLDRKDPVKDLTEMIRFLNTLE